MKRTLTASTQWTKPEDVNLQTGKAYLESCRSTQRSKIWEKILKYLTKLLHSSFCCENHKDTWPWVCNFSGTTPLRPPRKAISPALSPQGGRKSDLASNLAYLWMCLSNYPVGSLTCSQEAHQKLMRDVIKHTQVTSPLTSRVSQQQANSDKFTNLCRWFTMIGCICWEIQRNTSDYPPPPTRTSRVHDKHEMLSHQLLSSVPWCQAQGTWSWAGWCWMGEAESVGKCG